MAELNRAKGDNVTACVRQLNRRGVPARRLRHKTSIEIERPIDMSLPAFRNELRAILDPRKGSMILFSERYTGPFICNNRGNRPGVFVRP